MAVTETARHDFDHDEFLEERQQEEDLATLDDLVQDIQEDIIDDYLRDLESREEAENSDDTQELEKAFEEGTEDSPFLDDGLDVDIEQDWWDALEALEEFVGSGELENLESLEALETWENPLEDYWEELLAVPELEELEEEAIDTEEISTGYEEELFDLQTIDTSSDLERVDKTDELETLEDPDDLEDFDNLNDLNDIDDGEELEDLDDIQDLEDVEDLEDLEDFDDLEDDLDDLDDLEGLEELEEPEYFPDSEAAVDTGEWNENSDLVGWDEESQLHDLMDVHDLEPLEEAYEVEPAISSLESDTTVDSSVWDASQDLNDGFYTEILQLHADLHLLNAQLHAERGYSPEAPTSVDIEPLPSPSPFGISLEELSPSLSRDWEDPLLSSLEEQLTSLFSSKQWFDSSEEFLTPETQPSFPTSDNPPNLLWEEPPLPEPPPYDYLADLESFESLEERIIAHQLANPLYPYSTRNRKKRSLPRTNRSEVNEPRTHSDSLPADNKAPATNQELVSDQQTLDDFVISRISDPKIGRTRFPPSGAPVDDPKKGSPSRIESLPLEQNKVPTSRGVVKAQIEALARLKTLTHVMAGTTRIIALEASSREEMGEILLKKMGDFTYEYAVRRDGKRSLYKLTKETNWRPMREFIHASRVEKEVYNSGLNKYDWVIYNRKKDWVSTGNQRIKIELDMSKLNSYYDQLEAQARTLAKDTEQTRLYLSKKMKNISKYQDALRFWTHYGYQQKIRQVTQEYLKTQRKWTVTHQMIDGLAPLLEVIRAGSLDNNYLLHAVENWKNTHAQVVQKSTIVVRKGAEALTLEQILPASMTQDPRLLSGEIEINSLDEHQGATQVFQHQLESVIHDLQGETKNVLVEYLGLENDKVNKYRPIDSWGVRGQEKPLGVDAHDQEFRYTFAPDIAVVDPKENVVAVIQLKGKTQDRRGLLATMSTIQMFELIKYHVEHNIPTALVNIRQEGKGVKYEWLVMGRANTPPSPLMKQLIDSKAGLDPIIPRSARSHSYAKELLTRIKANKGIMDNPENLEHFHEFIDKAQRGFQNLPFYKRVQKSLDVENYWNSLMRSYRSNEIKELHKLNLERFYRVWKEVVVSNHTEQVKELGKRFQTINNETDLIK